MKLKFIYFFPLIFCLVSCQEKFSGASNEEFESSLIAVTKDLTAKEQENLEKALSIVAEHLLIEKWNNDKYSDKSINEMINDFVHNKTYSKLVNFAEDFLKKENEEKIENKEAHISEIRLKRKKAESIIAVLEKFKPTEITIVEGSWNKPKILVKTVNEGSSIEVTEYMFDLSIYSISQNKKIDGVGVGSSEERK